MKLVTFKNKEQKTKSKKNSKTQNMNVEKENTIIRHQNCTISKKNGNVYQNYTLDPEFMDIEVMCQTFL